MITKILKIIKIIDYLKNLILNLLNVLVFFSRKKTQKKLKTKLFEILNFRCEASLSKRKRSLSHFDTFFSEMSFSNSFCKIFSERFHFFSLSPKKSSRNACLLFICIFYFFVNFYFIIPCFPIYFYQNLIIFLFLLKPKFFGCYFCHSFSFKLFNFLFCFYIAFSYGPSCVKAFIFL